MIFGHLGIALGARAVDADAPLAWLVVASIAPDILDVGLAGAGVCNPLGEYTHTLLAVAATALVLGAAGGFANRRIKTGLVIGALVVSHLLADYITGLKPLWMGGPIVGLDLYRWPLADFVVETPVIIGGWWAARRWGNLPRWVASRATVAILLALQLGADATKQGGAHEPPSSCAKAFLFKGPERLL